MFSRRCEISRKTMLHGAQQLALLLSWKIYRSSKRTNVDEARDTFGISVLKRKASRSPMVFVTMLNEA